MHKSVLIAQYWTCYNSVEVRLYTFGLDIIHHSSNDYSLSCQQHDEMVRLAPVEGWNQKLHILAPVEEWEPPKLIELA